MTTDSHAPLVIFVHGGAGRFPEWRRDDAVAGCRAAAAVGWQVLADGGSALDAVEAAVRALEDNPVFNAGHGAVLNAAGQVELDAGIMDGATRQSGAVTLIQHFRHPITLARKVMTASPHNILGGAGAEAFARAQDCTPVDNDFFFTPYRVQQFQQRQQAETADTVGAVALDARGNLAAANSTGGISFKLPGRIGDSPLPGAGYYADNRYGAVATTGQGEHILRAGLSFLVMALLESGLSAPEAAAQVQARFQHRVPQGQAGWIIVDAAGRVGVGHSTQSIAHAWRTSSMGDVVGGMEAG